MFNVSSVIVTGVTFHLEFKSTDSVCSQNFDVIPHVKPGREAYYGGSVSLADYCPYIQEFTWRSKNVVIRGSHCQYPENNPRKPVLLFQLELKKKTLKN